MLMVVAQEGFRDEELLVPQRLLLSEGAGVDIASKVPGECRGMLGARAVSTLAVRDVDPGVYDAVVVVGGSGSPRYLWKDGDVIRTVKAAHSSGKVVAAICLSGAVLARAGVLRGIEATVYETPESLAEMRAGGAVYRRRDVVVSGRLITASGPHAAGEFARSIVDALQGA